MPEPMFVEYLVYKAHPALNVASLESKAIPNTPHLSFIDSVPFQG
jgi:hypothetical protein